MLKDTLRSQATAAMKARDTVAASIYRLAKGEIDTAEARAGKELADEEALAIVRKLIKSNEETLGATEDAVAKATLTRENELLRALLPASLSVDDLVAALAPVVEAIRAAKAEGPATGLAMKHVKSSGLAAESADVVSAVRKIRG